MAKQTINLGTAPNDKSGDPARTAFDKCNDNFDELYQDVSDIDAIVAATPQKVLTTCNGGNAQTITYSATRANLPPAIFDYEGNGIDLVSYDTMGFVINSIQAGNFLYL